MTFQSTTTQDRLHELIGELEQLLQTYSRAEELAGLGSWQHNAATGDHTFSDNLYRILGYEPRLFSLTPDNILNLVHPEDRDKCLNAFDQFMRARQHDGINVRITRPDGQQRVLNVTAHMNTNQNCDDIVQGIAKDITDYKTTEQKLRHLNRRLSVQNEAFEHAEAVSNIGSWRWNLDTGKIQTSDNLYRIYGVDPHEPEATWDTLQALAHPRDVERVTELMERIAERREPLEYEYRIVKPDGEERCLRVKSKPIENPDGECVIIGATQDITEQKLAEEKIKEQAHFVSRVTETVPDMISVMELPTRNVQFINRESFAFHGYDPHTFATLAPEERSQLVHPDDQDALIRYYEKFDALPDDGVATLDYRAKNLRGDWQWFRVRGKVFERDENGKVKNIVNVVQNINEQKQAEQEIHKHLTLLQQAEDIANTGSWEYDIATGAFRWSDGMYRFFDLPKGMDVQPEVYFDRAAYADKPVGQKIVNLLKQYHEPFEDVIRINQNGASKTLRVKANVMRDEKGQAVKMIGTDVDITEQVKAEQLIKQHLHFIEHITQASPDIIYVMNLDTHALTYRNGSCAESVGYDPDQIQAMENPMLDIVHPDDLQTMMEHIDEMLNAPDNEVREIEYRVVDPNGNVRWFQDRNVVFKRNAKNDPTHKLGFSHDITPQKEADEKLRRSEQQLKERSQHLELLIDTSVDIVVATDVHLDITMWNGVAEQRYGIRRENAVGKYLFDVFTELNDTAFRNLVDKAMTGEATHLPEIESPLLDGTFETHVLPVQQHGDAPQGLLWVMRDITPVYNLRQELARRKQFLESLLDNSVDRVMAVDKHGKLTAWNRLCELRHSVARENALGRLLTDVLPRYKHLPNAALVERAMKGEFVHMAEEKLPDEDGYVEWFMVPLRDNDGKPDGFLHVLHDITERKQAEQKLSAANNDLQSTNRELQRRNDELSTFAYVAGHDLKEPLRKIQMFVNVLRTRESQHLTVRGQDYMARVQNATLRMDQLLDDLLAYTAVSNDPNELKPVDLNVLLNGALADLAESIGQHKAVIKADKLPTVNVVPHQFRQLLHNLLSNAIKFRKPDTPPQVRISWESVPGDWVTLPELRKDRNYIRVIVSDNGIGFDPKDAKRMFELFSRIHDEDYPGTGLGLAICKKIAENHHGIIEAEGMPGRGATFTVYLPL